jgi:hypothetical protein
VNISRKHLPALALGISLALLAGCNKPADSEQPPPASDDMTAPAPQPTAPSTVAPPSSTSNSYDSGAPQGTSNEAPATVPPPVDSSDSSSQDATQPNQAATPDNPSSPPSGEGNGG